jgi:hypothetical protein
VSRRELAGEVGCGALFVAGAVTATALLFWLLT